MQILHFACFVSATLTEESTTGFAGKLNVMQFLLSKVVLGADRMSFSFRYVYHPLGGKHDSVVEELIATLCTYGVAALWLGPCKVVFIWAFFNCFGLNFELWTAKFFSMEPFTSFEVSKSHQPWCGFYTLDSVWI